MTKLSTFSDYGTNLIENDRRYSLRSWAEPSSNELKAVNGPESYHGRLKDQFYQHQFIILTT